eukprot:COSAG02_NODE_599_length_19741_cov_177.207311_11_plen_346_part_00
MEVAAGMAAVHPAAVSSALSVHLLLCCAGSAGGGGGGGRTGNADCVSSQVDRTGATAAVHTAATAGLRAATAMVHRGLPWEVRSPVTCSRVPHKPLWSHGWMRRSCACAINQAMFGRETGSARSVASTCSPTRGSASVATFRSQRVGTAEVAGTVVAAEGTVARRVAVVSQDLASAAFTADAANFPTCRWFCGSAPADDGSVALLVLLRCSSAAAPAGNIRPGDWQCPECGVNVFASKNECFRCQTRKPEGAGGGYGGGGGGGYGGGGYGGGGGYDGGGYGGPPGGGYGGPPGGGYGGGPPGGGKLKEIVAVLLRPRWDTDRCVFAMPLFLLSGASAAASSWLPL